MAGSRGGSAHPRRYRLTVRSNPGGVCVWVRNKFIIPGNWDEYLMRLYRDICVYPDNFKGHFSSWRPGKIGSVQPAEGVRDPDALIAKLVTFWFDRSRPGSLGLRSDARYDRLDRAVRICDTMAWPIVKATTLNRNHQVYVRTTLSAGHSSRLSPGELRRFPGIDASHVRYFEYEKPGGKMQGLKTICPVDSDCTCREQFRNKDLLNNIVSLSWRV